MRLLLPCTGSPGCPPSWTASLGGHTPERSRWGARALEPMASLFWETSVTHHTPEAQREREREQTSGFHRLTDVTERVVDEPGLCRTQDILGFHPHGDPLDRAGQGQTSQEEAGAFPGDAVRDRSRCVFSRLSSHPETHTSKCREGAGASERLTMFGRPTTAKKHWSERCHVLGSKCTKQSCCH